VVLARTLAKKDMLMSVATKIAIQLNVKMGGEVWSLEIPVSKIIGHLITECVVICNNVRNKK